MSDKVLREFLETPLIELTDFGLPMLVVNALERKFGIFIKHLQTVRDEDVAALPNVGVRRVFLLKLAMRRCYQAKLTSVE